MSTFSNGWPFNADGELLKRAFEVAKRHVNAGFDFAYSSALDGIGGFGGAVDLANEYANEYRAGKASLRECGTRLVKMQCLKSGASGFATGLGGPLTTPISITAVLYFQVVMIAAIAHMSGRDIHSDEVKAAVYALIIGDTIISRARDGATGFGKAIARKGITCVPGGVLKQINKVGGARWITKGGTTGIVNLGKAVPLAGGFVGAAFDSSATWAVGMKAVSYFFSE